MAKWYEIPESGRDAEQAKAAQLAYYQTLLAGPYGRQVVADLFRRSREIEKEFIGDKEMAQAILILNRFIHETMRLCGADDIMQMVSAMGRIAQSRKVDVDESSIDPAMQV